MKIDESQLPPGWDDGLAVERDGDGAIRKVVADRGAESIVLELDDERVVIRETSEMRWDSDPSVLHAVVLATLHRMQGKREGPGLRCSFCGKSSDEVRKLIAGPCVYICDECIALCGEILDAE